MTETKHERYLRLKKENQMKALIALLEKLDCSIIGLATIGIDINEVTQKWIDSSFVAYIGSNI